MRMKEIVAYATAGFALFAMFFGAGNIVFPLSLGAHTTNSIGVAVFAYLLSGVGIPFLGLFTISFFRGDYWKFFDLLHPAVATFILTFCVLIIGPFFAAPRTETVTHATLLHFLPGFLQGDYIFSLIYFIIIYFLVANRMGIVDILGYFISPFKVASFVILIVVSLKLAPHMVPVTAANTKPIFKEGLEAFLTGYNTMDLIAAIFFGAAAYQNIVKKSQTNMVSSSKITHVTLKACLLGAILLSLIYGGLMLAAYRHSASLQETGTASMIQALSYSVMGTYGSLFVCICVSLACITTASAVTEVSAVYFHKLFKEKFSKHTWLLIMLVCMQNMAVIGFDNIMKIAGPILTYLYPVLIGLCLVNLWRLARQGKLVLSHASV